MKPTDSSGNLKKEYIQQLYFNLIASPVKKIMIESRKNRTVNVAFCAQQFIT